MKSLLISYNDLKQLKKIKNYLEIDGWECDISFSSADAAAKMALFNYDFHLMEYAAFLERMENAGSENPLKAINSRTVIIGKKIGKEALEALYKLGITLVLEAKRCEKIYLELNELLKLRAKKSVLNCSDLSLDSVKRIVKRGNKIIALKNKEFCLLNFFIKNAGAVVTREQIIADVWDREANIFTNTVDVHVHKLRKKIDKDFPVPLIKTIPYVGYQFGEFTK